jgi:hypothetical protein
LKITITLISTNLYLSKTMQKKPLLKKPCRSKCWKTKEITKKLQKKS